jgi:carnitine 3-dehydrogenase
MGLGETYRVAGGEAGMKHFMAHFGPALKWPWTKLMDVPDLTDELVDTIADQSDEQSGQYSIRELERIRDKNLVGMMRALKIHDYGAGALLNAQDALMYAEPKVEQGKPLRTTDRVVPTDWVDYNGHMNDARYLQAFSESMDCLLGVIGAGEDYVAAGHSFFTVENHLRYLDEVKTGTRITVDTQVIKAEGKKLHVFQEMRRANDGALCATAEQMFVHVSLTTRAACEPVGEVLNKIATLADAHSDLDLPKGAGRFVGERHKA